MNFFQVHISSQAIDSATEVLKSGWISEGYKVKEFEAALSERLGLHNPVAVNSGTSALHLALSIAQVGWGHEVILPAQTFVATGMVVLAAGAKPVFADIQPDTGNICPRSISEKITERTRAIIAVHWGGYPCDLDEINDLAERNNLIVIEDAAHALGASYKGKPVGSISRFTAFSFQAIKHLTTGDGGALCCLDEQDYINALNRRWFGIDRDNDQPSLLGEREYNIKEVGYNYHMNNLAAAVGLGNLENFPSNLKRRREVAKLYRDNLKDVPGLQLLNYKDDRDSAYWLFTVLVERREDFIRALKSKNIPTSVVHLRIDKNSVFGVHATGLPGQEKFNDTQIAIPIHSDLTHEDVELVIRTIKNGW
jgi:perosamine synthetase